MSVVSPAQDLVGTVPRAVMQASDYLQPIDTRKIEVENHDFGQVLVDQAKRLRREKRFCPADGAGKETSARRAWRPTHPLRGGSSPRLAKASAAFRFFLDCGDQLASCSVLQIAAVF